MITEREYVEEELRAAEARLRDVTDSARQTDHTGAGAAYREQLRRDISHLRTRLREMEDEDARD